MLTRLRQWWERQSAVRCVVCGTVIEDGQRTCSPGCRDFDETHPVSDAWAG